LLTDRIIQLNGRSRVVMATALNLILLYAVYGWVMAPHVLYVKAVHQCEPVVERMQRQTTSLEGGISAAQDDLDDLQDAFEALRTTLFGYEEAKDFFSELERWAQDDACSVNTVRVDGNRPIRILPDLEKDSMIEAIGAEVTVTGPLQGLSSFIRKLQKYPRRIYIQTLQLNTTHALNQAMQCHIDLTVYVLHE